MRGRVGKNGEVVIPKILLKAVGLRAGDEIHLSVAGDAIRVERVLPADMLMGHLAGHPLVAALAADRKAERRR